MTTLIETTLVSKNSAYSREPSKNRARSPMFYPLGVIVLVFAQTLMTGCAHKKGIIPVTRQHLQSKRVALAEIKGAPESVKHVEVAIVNEILDEGRFEIVDRATVQDALVAYPTEHDFAGLGKKVGADYVLGIKIKGFQVKERKGYDKLVEADSVLTEESGQTKPVIGTRYFKVKSHEGQVQLECTFFDVSAGQITYSGIGQANETEHSRDTNSMGKLQLLERLSGKAIADFFNKMP